MKSAVVWILLSNNILTPEQVYSFCADKNLFPSYAFRGDSDRMIVKIPTITDSEYKLSDAPVYYMCPETR